jgi:hypothetical protein
MPAATTLFGFPYPVGTDRVADGDDAIHSLAQKLEDQLSGQAGTVPGAPYRSQSGALLMGPSLAAGQSLQVALTFAAGRFTQSPAVVMGGTSNGYLACSSGPATTTSVSLRVVNVGAGNISTQVYAHYMAVQQTPSGPAVAAEAIGTPFLATCDTDGCDNADIAIPILWDDPEGDPPTVVCGVCGEPIADVISA